MATVQQRKIFMYKQKSISGILNEARKEVYMLDGVRKLPKIIKTLNPDDHVFEDEAAITKKNIVEDAEIQKEYKEWIKIEPEIKFNEKL